MARATRNIPPWILLSLISGTAAGWSPIGPPGRSVHSLVLERRGYRVGENPPAAAMFAGTDAGIFRGDGDGAWDRVDSEPGSPPITALAIFQRERPVEEPVVAHRTWIDYETVIYAATRSALLRSVDGGSTWRSMDTPSASPAHSLGADRSGAVYVATEEEVFRSADRGGNWARIGAGLPRPIRCVTIDGNSPGVLYAGAGAGVYRSADGGRAWAALRARDGARELAVESIAVDPSSPSSLFIAGRETDRGRPLSSATAPAAFSSRDGGKSWTRLARPVGGPLLFDRSSPPLLYATAQGGALQTRDGGATWTAAGEAAAQLGAVLAVDLDWPGRLYGRTPQGDFVRVQARCGGDASALCLRDGRFRIQIEWDAGAPASDGVPAATSKADGEGSFWIARPSNVVLNVEVYPSPSRPGRFWIDFDARTSRGFGVVVTDMATGTSTRYSHPEGQRTKFTDHGAF